MAACHQSALAKQTLAACRACCYFGGYSRFSNALALVVVVVAVVADVLDIADVADVAIAVAVAVAFDIAVGIAVVLACSFFALRIFENERHRIGQIPRPGQGLALGFSCALAVYKPLKK